MKTRLLLSLLVFLNAPLDAAEIEKKRFRLGKNGEQEVGFQLNQTGTLTARVVLQGSFVNRPVRVTLIAPDGREVKKEGAAPLRLRYELNDTSRFGSWRAVVKNHAKMTLLEGHLRLDFEAKERPITKQPSTTAPPSEMPAETPAVAASPPAPSPAKDLTDGEVQTVQDMSRIRAVCRGRNDDVFIRLDMEAGQGTYFMSYQPIFPLKAAYRTESVIEINGGAGKFLLDLNRKTLVMDTEKRPVFCQTRLYFGEL